MTEQEAQQAQTIKRYTCEIDIDCIRDVETPDGDFVMYSDHKAIVDSQAQEMAKLRADVENYKDIFDRLNLTGLKDKTK